MNAMNPEQPITTGLGWNLTECHRSGNAVWAPAPQTRISRKANSSKTPDDTSGRGTPSSKA